MPVGWRPGPLKSGAARAFPLTVADEGAFRQTLNPYCRRARAPGSRRVQCGAGNAGTLSRHQPGGLQPQFPRQYRRPFDPGPGVGSGDGQARLRRAHGHRGIRARYVVRQTLSAGPQPRPGNVSWPRVWPASWGRTGIHVAYIVVDALIDMPFAKRAFPDKPKDFFSQPADLAETVFRTAHQPKSALVVSGRVTPVWGKMVAAPHPIIG